MCISFLKFFLLQLFVFFVITVIILMFVLDRYKDDVVILNKSQAIRVENMSKTVFSSIDHLASSLSVDMAVINYAVRSKEMISTADKSELTKNLLNYKNVVNYINSIYIYSPVRNIFLTNEGERNTIDFPDAAVVDMIDKTSESNTQLLLRKMNGNYPNVITYVKKIKNSGYVIVNLDYSKYISEIRSGMEETTSVYVLTDDNHIAFDSGAGFDAIPDTVTVGKQYNTKDNEANKCVYTMLSVGYYNHRLLVLTDYTHYYENVLHTVKTMILIAILFIVVSILIAVFITFSSFSVIMKLYDVADRKGVDISEFKNNETKYIATRIMTLIDDNKYLEEQLVSKIANYNDAKLVALQQQISPHFLGNVLSAISFEIVNACGCDTPALNMIVKLTRMTGYSFEKDTIFVSLSDELEFIDNYVDLLRCRYGDFKYSCEVSEDLKDKKIPKLSIQPLIENAVYHGICDMSELGHVKLVCEVKDGRMLLEVSDNGVGMKQEDIDGIYKSLGNDNTGHVGINNIYKRLNILYADEGDIQIESEYGKYTRVRLIFPE